MKNLQKFGAWIWYPWLAALFPAIFLYAHNFDKVYSDDFLVACLLLIAAAGLVVGLLWLLVRDKHKAAAVALALIIPFFAYGPIVDQLGQDKNTPLLQLPLLPIMLAVGVIAAAAIALKAPSASLLKMTPNLNILAVGLVVFNLVTLAIGEYNAAATAQSRKDTSAEVRAPKIDDDPEHPDVYYIILDAYPSNSSLLADSGIDNTEFTDSLEDRGFFVAYDSTSNYPQTLPSISSSLNMRYLDSEEAPAGPAGVSYARGLIADSDVAKNFLSLGYTYIFILSGFDQASTTADMNIDVMNHELVYFPRGGPLPTDADRKSFWPVLLDTTMLADQGLEDVLALNQDYRPDRWQSPQRILATLDEAPKIAANPAATFAIIHVIIPHVPIRFSKTGEILTGDQLQAAKTRKRKQAFADEMVWLNGRVLQLIDDIESKSDTQPIIIIQGDHGSKLGEVIENREAHFYHILNAYHFPGEGGTSGLSQEITPVNSFRVLFNTYFGGSYDMLAPRHFALPEQYEDAFDFKEIPAP